MRKLFKAMLKPNKNSGFFEKQVNLKDEVHKSLLRIIISPQVYSYLIKTALNAATLSIIYKFKDFRSIPSFWVKITQHFLCLLVCSKPMINGSKSSVCLSQVGCSVDYFPVFCHKSIAGFL